jgi:hypothetical protein
MKRKKMQMEGKEGWGEMRLIFLRVILVCRILRRVLGEMVKARLKKFSL